MQDTIVVQNSAEPVALLERYPFKLVLQGHTHINERVSWRGIDFITTGAVSGNWWKGPRLAFPEGYAVLDVSGDKVSWRSRVTAGMLPRRLEHNLRTLRSITDGATGPSVA